MEFEELKKVRTLYYRGVRYSEVSARRELTVMRCPYLVGVRKAGFDCNSFFTRCVFERPRPRLHGTVRILNRLKIRVFRCSVQT